MTTERDEWLSQRQTGIGASEAAASVGLSNWKPQLQLFLEKAGLREPEDLSDREEVAIGLVMEPVIAELYTAKTGREIVRPGYKLRKHPDYDFIFATLDGETTTKDRIVEMKNIGHFSYIRGGWGDVDSEEVPTDYFLQVQHQLGVTGYDVADLAVLIAGQKFRVYEIQRDDELIRMLTEKQDRFWNENVLTKTPPVLDYHNPKANDLLKTIYPGTDGTTIVLDDGFRLAEEYQKFAAAESDAKKKREALKAEISDLMKNASVGIVPGLGGFTRKMITRVDPPRAEERRSEYIKLGWSKKPTV